MIKNPISKLLGAMHLIEPGSAAKADMKAVKYPGVRDAIDGNTAVILVEREASDAAGAYPITPSTNMGEYWSEAAAAGHVNISGRPLIFLEPESEHAAAGVTAGMAMTGLRSVNFSSAQGVAFMHESLYGAVGKRLPYVLNMGCRAITKATLNVHCGHDDYHCHYDDDQAGRPHLLPFRNSQTYSAPFAPSPSRVGIRASLARPAQIVKNLTLSKTNRRSRSWCARGIWQADLRETPCIW